MLLRHETGEQIVNEVELKPCPFCGNPARVIQVPDGMEYEGVWVVGCDDDFRCLGSMVHMAVIFTTKGEAVKAWNRRTVNE